MKKIVIRLAICIYLLVAALTTINLLKYNEQNLTQYGDSILIKLDENISSYSKGSLLIVKKAENYQAGDNVFYCDLKKEQCKVKFGKVDTAMGSSPIINNETISEKMVIGKDEDIRVIPALGSVMRFLESRWGYFCVVVLPVLVGFIYELYSIIKETKNKK